MSYWLDIRESNFFVVGGCVVVGCVVGGGIVHGR